MCARAKLADGLASRPHGHRRAGLGSWCRLLLSVVMVGACLGAGTVVVARPVGGHWCDPDC